MKLGPRVAIVTTVIMAGVLVAGTAAVLQMRRGDLERDLRRQAGDLAHTLAAGLQPLVTGPAKAAGAQPLPTSPVNAREAIERRIASMDGSAGRFRIEIVALATQRPSNIWAGLVEEANATDGAVGGVFQIEGRPRSFAMVVPLHSAGRENPLRQTVALVGLSTDLDFIDTAVAQDARRILPYLGCAVLAFGVVIYLLLRGSVVRPLRRLVEAIDAVSKGDLSRAVLPQRDDEIGSLAGRFNAMTNYLRDAREEEARANTARLALETRLRHSEKLATMGQMAAEIAHEVGTPLNVIGGRARSIAKRPADPTEVKKNADIVIAQVDRIAKIIRQVLDFSRKNRPTLTDVDVASAVHEALGFVDEPLRRQRIAAQVQTASDLPRVPGDPEEIQQVVLNLLMNAVHAMPAGGTVSVVVDCVIRRKEGLALAPPSPYMMLQVSDTGQGVPPADRERIFEAFFTTKGTGEGTGLGLAVSKGIVKDHDGWIEVDEGPQGGAVFRVFLPLGEEPVGALAQTP